MSLINDALKKAARQRAEEQGEIAPMPGGGSRSSRQSGPMGKQTLVLVGAAAVALIVVSAVITGILVTSKPEAKPVAAAKAAPDAPPLETAPKAIVLAPIVSVSLAQAPAPTAAPTEMPTPVPKPSPMPVPAAAAPTAAPEAQRIADNSQGHTDMVQTLVDGFHISGVRTAGSGSKALINGHIFKLNDVVDKSLGLKLVKVDEDHLTFVDRDGNTFVKSF